MMLVLTPVPGAWCFQERWLQGWILTYWILKEEQGMKDTELVKFTAGSGNGNTSDGPEQSFVEREREVRLQN